MSCSRSWICFRNSSPRSVSAAQRGGLNWRIKVMVGMIVHAVAHGHIHRLEVMMLGQKGLVRLQNEGVAMVAIRLGKGAVDRIEDATMTGLHARTGGSQICERFPDQP
jgi:hypothetical protein